MLQAPPSFQPNIDPPATNANNNQSSGGMGSVSALLRNATKKEEIDLITRYNLQSRVKTADKGKERADPGSGEGGEGRQQGQSQGQSQVQSGWAATKDARQSILQRRRDEMILEARRKMLEKDAAGRT